MDYGKVTIVKSLASYQVGKLSVACKDLRKALVMANNGVKPHTDKNKQVVDNRQ